MNTDETKIQIRITSSADSEGPGQVVHSVPVWMQVQHELWWEGLVQRVKELGGRALVEAPENGFPAELLVVETTDLVTMMRVVEAERKRLLSLSSDRTILDHEAEGVLLKYCGKFIVWRNNPTLGGPRWPTCPGNPAMPTRCPGCLLKKNYDEYPDDYEPAITG